MLPGPAMAPAIGPADSSPAPTELVRSTSHRRPGLWLGAVGSFAGAVGLDIASAQFAADCARFGETSRRCTVNRPETVGLGLSALALYVTSFSVSAAAGYMHGARATARPRSLRAAAWAGGILVSAGLMGAALSGLATGRACEGACDPRDALTASALRGVALLATNIGVGTLTWREGSRRLGATLALGQRHLGVSVQMSF